MQKYLRNALLFLIAAFALLAIMGQGTNATAALKNTNPLFLVFAAAFFIFSIVLWLISWSYLIKKRCGLGIKTGLFVGFSSVYGALTPVQVGAELLRAMSLKQRFDVPYTDSIAASMVVKGIKFLFIALLSTAIIVLFLSVAQADFFILLGLGSGFIVVLLATALFLLPMRKSFGAKIALFFQKLSHFIKAAARLEKFFLAYSNYLSTLGKKSLLVVAIFSALSLFFEFMALLFSFYAIAVHIPLASIAVLFVLISILERTPFLPRGIGVVEAVGFAYLSVPFITASSISVESIGALLILFDFVRLVVPSLLSISMHVLLASKGRI